MPKNILHSDHSELWKSLANIIPDCAKLSGFVQRVSETFHPAAFFLTLLSAVANGKTSFNDLASSLSEKEDSAAISPQAINDRIIRTEVGLESFLIRCLTHICSWKWNHTQDQSDASNTIAGLFGRVIVEDSTFLPFDKSNAEEFPASGNSKGKTAGCKINLAFDLKNGSILSNELVLGTQQDKTSGWDIIDKIIPNDLVLRDMGYFSVEMFAAIAKKGGYWLSRLPLNVGATSIDGKPLEELLRKHHGNRLDIEVKLTADNYPARLVAIRASKEETEKRCRKIHQKAKAKGRTADSRTLFFAGWHILVTNIPADKVSVEGLAKIYSQRWQIEIVFRGWKQALGLSQALAKKNSSQYIKGLVIASMIILALGVKIAISLSRIRDERYSLEKIYKYLAEKLCGIKKLLELSSMCPNPRYVKTQKRKRKSLSFRYFECLG